ncbi:MAG: 4Fe-4S binding protein [Nitrospirota bacterium]|jgi:polyferredoxin
MSVVDLANRSATFWRRLVQVGFAALTLWLGVGFIRFVHQAQAGGAVTQTRPPGVEGFLPISGMLGLRHWLESGHLNSIHPAAVVLFLAIVATAFVAKKGFCSWVCPVGTLSEGLAILGARLLGRNYRLPRWLDVPLRTLKYALLGFFLWIVVTIPAAALEPFLYGDYHRVADVKTYLFFARIGPVALAVVVALVAGSMVVRGLWCRYACPYGALLGLVGWLSPARIRRDPESCSGCEGCTTACPQRLPVHARLAVASVECTACHTCVDACPKEGTLVLGVGHHRIVPWRVAALLVGVFVVAVVGARVAGRWQSAVPVEEYAARIRTIDQVSHARPGSASVTGPAAAAPGVAR